MKQIMDTAVPPSREEIAEVVQEDVEYFIEVLQMPNQHHKSQLAVEPNSDAQEIQEQIVFKVIPRVKDQTVDIPIPQGMEDIMEALPHERVQPVSPRPRKKARRRSTTGGCGQRSAAESCSCRGK